MFELDHVVVLAGGLSPEREVSLRSGRRIRDSLVRLGIDAAIADADAGLLRRLTADPPSAVFPVIHGSCGEDGAIREVLGLLRMPYVGSAARACQMAFDKPTAKAVVAATGVRTPGSITLPRETFHDLGAAGVIDLIVARLGLPLYVKPSRGGSALGSGPVHTGTELSAALLSCFAYGDIALIEQLVSGIEVAVGVIDLGDGPRALPPVEIVPGDSGYDYAARYTAGSTEFYIPARLSAAAANAVVDAAITAHSALGLRDLSRTDLIVDDTDTVHFLEVNVAPGMTETSTLPLALEATGHEFGDTCVQLLELAATRGGLARCHPRRAASPEAGRAFSPAMALTRLVDMTKRKSFGSDNHAGTHPAVMRALMEANEGDMIAYGADSWTDRVTAQLRDLFGAEGEAFLVLNGSGANILGLSIILGRHEAVICAESAHINTDECGSAERLLGTKLLTVPSPDGKITADGIAEHLDGRGDDHRAQPGAVAITQATEVGTCYTLAEMRKIADFCRSNDLRLYIDGARLANAAAHLDCTLAEIAECADVLSFGGTKNGALGAEALIVMRRELTANVPYLRKQVTQLTSKMRFVAAQFAALLDDELWRFNASHANEMARKLAEGAGGIEGVEVAFPVQSNAVFARLSPHHTTAIQRDWFFHVWNEQQGLVRWMTAFDTAEADVNAFLATIRETAAG